MLNKYEKALITGNNGWLGQGLYQMITQGYQETKKFFDPYKGDVWGFDYVGENFPHFFKGDIRNREQCESFLKNGKDSIVFHLAGIIHPKHVRAFYEINLEGTKNIVELAIKKGVQKLVIMSSNSPIGCNGSPDECFDENSPYAPYMNYGRSKMLMEQAMQSYKNDMDIVIIRAPWFYGPNQPERQTLFFKMIKDGKFPLVGNGFNRRSMAYIDNLCLGLILAAESSTKSGDVFWIADEKPYTMLEIIKTVQNALKVNGLSVKESIPKIPYVVGQVAEVADRLLQKLGVYHQKIHVLSEMNKTIACRIDKAQKELDYQPQIDIKEGMKRSIQWCLEKGYL